MSRLNLLGENIRKFRNQKGWSQQVLADYLVLTREHISRVENGQEYLSLRKVFLLADTLGVKVSELFNFD
ncbi:MAG: helix-turn-helix domain-containing protein [Heliobacteriaceae bacterium]|jgi:transcriptional regulator with XRE-family HTH domain|nr:helix-turn-helix domain-containing protein [Heliobacteriaceae bacterium]